ncbi:response regulator transcription factor [Actinocorallia lasiicapitis]
MSEALVLVVDDERAVRDSVRRILEFEGYRVIVAANGNDALAKARGERPDLIVLDVMLPGPDGVSVCRILRDEDNDVPVLMLTAREAVAERIAGLDSGADDYLTKPFSLEELLARVRAVLRRRAPAPQRVAYACAGLVLNTATREAARDGRPLGLTATEFSLLRMLMSRPGQVLTRAEILKEVWSLDFETSTNLLDVYVMYLRRKTEEGGLPRLVHNVRGVGYVLRPEAP